MVLKLVFLICRRNIDIDIDIDPECLREECPGSSLSLREEISLGRWRKLHNAEIYDFHSATG
jgi:hypothetical protein